MNEPRSDAEGSCEQHDVISPEMRQAIQEEVARQLDEFAERVADLVIQKMRATSENPILPEVSEEHRVILTELLSISSTDLSAGQEILNKLIGVRLTRELTRSIAKIMKEKSWGLACPTCQEPSGLGWSTTRSGQVQFTHTDKSTRRTVTHSGMIFMDGDKVRLVHRPKRRSR